MKKFILIIGATSDIARAISREYAKEKYNLYLANRTIESLEELKSDLEIRYGIEVILRKFCVSDFDTHQNFYDNLESKPEGVIYASGYLPLQEKINFTECLETVNVNYLGAMSILNIFADEFEKKKGGFIIGITSVAGDRGKASNYIYGSSKAAFDVYLSGLRNRLFKSNVLVLTVRPGFVKTNMTKNMKLPKYITAEPFMVANDVIKAYKKKKNIIYTKKIWFFIMLIIRLIPESIFKKLNL